MLVIARNAEIALTNGCTVFQTLHCLLLATRLVMVCKLPHILVSLSSQMSFLFLIQKPFSFLHHYLVCPFIDNELDSVFQSNAAAGGHGPR